MGGPFITVALLLYGAGIGLESIARGTLPLAVFGPERYPVIMGRIAMPSLIAQAAAPTIGALLLKTGGLTARWWYFSPLPPAMLFSSLGCFLSCSELAKVKPKRWPLRGLTLLRFHRVEAGCQALI